MWETSVAKLACRGRSGLTGEPPLLLLLILFPRAGDECMTRRERAVSSSTTAAFKAGEYGGGGATIFPVVVVAVAVDGLVDDVILLSEVSLIAEGCWADEVDSEVCEEKDGRRTGLS